MLAVAVMEVVFEVTYISVAVGIAVVTIALFQGLLHFDTVIGF